MRPPGEVLRSGKAFHSPLSSQNKAISSIELPDILADAEERRPRCNSMDFRLNNKVIIPEWWLNEKILRAKKAGVKINDLFLVVPVNDGEAGEISLNTKYGWLRVFFCSQLMEFHKYEGSTPKILLLDHNKYNYPEISKTSSRPFRKINGEASHIKRDETKRDEIDSTKSYEVN
jgi:hypothetical protein